MDDNLITFLNDMDKTAIEEKGEKRLDEEEKEEEKSLKKAKRKKKVVLKPALEKEDEEQNKNDNEVFTNGIEASLNSWLQQIVYIESVFKTSKNAQLQIQEVLGKMQTEGRLSSNEFNALK